jgi:hypothetical protein
VVDLREVYFLLQDFLLDFYLDLHHLIHQIYLLDLEKLLHHLRLQLMLLLKILNLIHCNHVVRGQDFLDHLLQL